MQHSPDPVALVVVTWNSAELIPGLVESLAEGMAGLRWQLVVADNDSHDDTVTEVRRLAPTALVVQTGRNAGYAAAINHALAAIAQQGSDVGAVLICNPDIRMRPGCGAALVAGLDLPGTGITAPVLYDGNGVLARS